MPAAARASEDPQALTVRVWALKRSAAGPGPPRGWGFHCTSSAVPSPHMAGHREKSEGENGKNKEMG